MNEKTSSTVIEGNSSGTKNFSLTTKIILICVGLAVLMVASSFFLSGESNSNGRKKDNTGLAGGLSESALTTSPEDVVDPEIKKTIIDKHNEEVEKKSGDGVATVTPVMGVSIDSQPESNSGVLADINSNKAKKVPVRPKSEKNKSKKKDINPYTAKVKDVFSQWDQKTKKSNGVNLYIPQDILDEIDGANVIANDTVDTAQESRLILKESGVDYLQVIPATLELGYNSDMGGLMIVSVHHKGLRGVKFQAEASVGAYGERAAITVRKGVFPDGRIISVEGVIVDQDDRVPSVKGKVDRHVIHNTVFGLGTALLDSFARYKELDAGLVNDLSLFPNITGSEQTIDTDGLVVANGADALSRSLKENGSFRPNTLNTKAFKTVGIVFLP